MANDYRVTAYRKTPPHYHYDLRTSDLAYAEARYEEWSMGDTDVYVYKATGEMHGPQWDLMYLSRSPVRDKEESS